MTLKPCTCLCRSTVASESWDDDFLWQHSSCSDLHLPSLSQTARGRTGRGTKYSSNSFSSLGSELRSEAKGSSSTTIASEDDDPTITLKTGLLHSRTQTSPAAPVKPPPFGYTPAHPSTARVQGAPASSPRSFSAGSHLAPSSRTSTAIPVNPPSSPSPSPSSFFSWRSQTPSLTSDPGALSSTTYTESDNETEGGNDEPVGGIHGATPRNSFSLFGGKGRNAVSRLPLHRLSSVSSTSTAATSAHMPGPDNVNPGPVIFPLHDHIHNNRTIRARQTTSSSVTLDRTPKSSAQSAWSANGDRGTSLDAHDTNVSLSDDYYNQGVQLDTASRETFHPSSSTTSLANSVASSTTGVSFWSDDSGPRPSNIKRTHSNQARPNITRKKLKKETPRPTSSSSVASSYQSTDGFRAGFTFPRSTSTASRITVASSCTESSTKSGQLPPDGSSRTTARGRTMTDSSTDGSVRYIGSTGQDHEPTPQKQLSGRSSFVSLIPFPSPERKRSGRLRQNMEDTSTLGPSASIDSKQKGKRPLSFSALLGLGLGSTETTSWSKARPISGNLSAHSNASASFLPPNSKSQFRKGHRATASHSNVPSTTTFAPSSSKWGSAFAEALLQTLTDRATLPGGGTRPPSPILEAVAVSSYTTASRRSSDLRISPYDQLNFQAERPPSSVSYLSETSTVRPSFTHRPQVRQQAGSSDPSQDVLSKPAKTQEEHTKFVLRRRHLPSLSLSLLSGLAPKTTRPSTATGPPGVPLASPPPMPRTASARVVTSGGYFAQAQHEFLHGSSPGGHSLHSDGSTSGLVRRVSLSDLKIPPRISSVQAKIGQDLKRVKVFKEEIEELKQLRRVYRSLMAADHDHSTANEGSGAALGQEDWISESPPPVPVMQANAKVEHVFARVAVDYQKWWEMADVLINLADGTDTEAQDDLSLQQSSERTSCRSVISGFGEATDTVKANIDAPSARTGTQVRSQPGLTAKSANPDIAQQSAKPLLSSNLTSQVPPPLLRSISASALGTPSSAHKGRSADVGSKREIVSMADTSSDFSERQLEILRGMLNTETQQFQATLRPPQAGLASPRSVSLGQPAPPKTPLKLRPTPTLHPVLHTPPTHLSVSPTRGSPTFVKTVPSVAQPDTPTQSPLDKKKSTGRLRAASRAGILSITNLLRIRKRSSQGPLSPRPTQDSPLDQEHPLEKTTIDESKNSSLSRMKGDTRAGRMPDLVEHTLDNKQHLQGSTKSMGSDTESSDEDWDKRSSETEGSPSTRPALPPFDLATRMSHPSSSVTGNSSTSLGKIETSSSRDVPDASAEFDAIARLPEGLKLVMTTDAMPTLLAKIAEVKMHCLHCVTELRYVRTA